MATTSYCARCLTSFGGDLDACPNLACGSKRPEEGWGVLLGPGDLLDRHYRIERCLAVGGAGLTYLAQEVDADEEPVGPRLAVKVLYSARAAGPFLRRLANEAQILQELAHEHLVQLRGFVHRAGHEPYLVTLFEEGGSLAHHIDRVGRLQPRIATAIVRQILLALDVAHQRGVVHRDLKPDNVLLSAPVPAEVVPHCRVADFGIAKVSGGVSSKLTRQGAFVGTPEYAAPEQFEGQQPTPATDVFATGGLLVFLLTGHPPVRFTHRGDIETSYEELLAQVPPRLEPGDVDATPAELELLQRVVDHTMAVATEARWTIQQTLLELQPLLARTARTGTLEVTGSPAPRRDTDPSITFTIEPTEEGSDAPPAPPPSLLGASDAPPPPPPTMVPDPLPPIPPPPNGPESVSDAPIPSLKPPPPPPPPEEEEPAETITPPETEEQERAAVASFAEPPEPPPFVPSMAPQPSPVPYEEEPPAAGGWVARVAGCMGLSVFGMGVVGVGGVTLVGLLLVGAAWGMGWFTPGSGVTPPIVVEDGVEERMREAPRLSDVQRRKVAAAIKARASNLQRYCGRGASIDARLLLDRSGSVIYAVVERRNLGKVSADCVERGLERITVRGVSSEGKTDVSFRL